MWPKVCGLVIPIRVFFLQTVVTKSKAHNCIDCLFFLALLLFCSNFSSFNLWGANKFQNNNATMLKAHCINTWFTKIGVEQLELCPKSELTLNTFGMNWDTDCTPGPKEELKLQWNVQQAHISVMFRCLLNFVHIL